MSHGMERILVIEDDRSVQKALARLFGLEKYEVELAGTGTEGLEKFRGQTYSAVLLDLRLPGTPGPDVCREIKAAAPGLPVIILSAKSEVADKVMLLELGADDYVTKPFSPRELLARVRAAIRRSLQHNTPHTLAEPDAVFFADVQIDFARMEVLRGTELVALTAQEFKVLKFLCARPGIVISRNELLNEVWGYQNYPSTRTVDNHILRLRQKLEPDPSNPVHFRTVHSAGYKFVR